MPHEKKKHTNLLVSILPLTFHICEASISSIMALQYLVALYFVSGTLAREITFPPVSGYASQQVISQGYIGPDITQAKFAGLMTYANLPYVHCLAPQGQQVEPFDIAILGAPFDTVSRKQDTDNRTSGAHFCRRKS